MKKPAKCTRCGHDKEAHVWRYGYKSPDWCALWWHWDGIDKPWRHCGCEKYKPRARRVK